MYIFLVGYYKATVLTCIVSDLFIFFCLFLVIHVYLSLHGRGQAESNIVAISKIAKCSKPTN